MFSDKSFTWFSVMLSILHFSYLIELQHRRHHHTFHLSILVHKNKFLLQDCSLYHGTRIYICSWGPMCKGHKHFHNLVLYTQTSNDTLLLQYHRFRICHTCRGWHNFLRTFDLYKHLHSTVRRNLEEIIILIKIRLCKLPEQVLTRTPSTGEFF